MSTAQQTRPLLAAARAARKFISQCRRVIVDSHSTPPRHHISTVKNLDALEWIAEHDEVMAKLDAAIARATSEGGT